MNRLRIVKKYCRLLHTDVFVIEEGRPSALPGDGVAWHFKHCLRMDRDCFAHGCRRHAALHLDTGEHN